MSFQRPLKMPLKEFAALALTLLLSTGAVGQTPDSAPAESSSGSRDKFMNLRFSPLGLLIGYINLDVDFKVGDQWTLGPTISYWSFEFDNGAFTGNRLRAESKALGARANWYSKGTFQTGMYLSPIVQFASATVTGTSRSTGLETKGTASATFLSALIGYQWFYETFNISLGAGLATSIGSSKVTATDGTSTAEADMSQTGGLALDFMFGFTF